ncbi:MAG: sugar transferase [Pseudomonadota bacterium]
MHFADLHPDVPTRAAKQPSPAALPLSKRLLDICAASAALILLSPVLICTMIAVMLTSPGGAFFVQNRVGYRGGSFGMIKFRSMYKDADARRAALVADSDRSGVCFKLKNDPRITPVGRFIRRYSIDELPQLINVLIGDMSLVGPRPALPQEVSQYPQYARERLNALPGITGVWQVSGRADVSFEDMVAMDIAYVRGVSLWSDLRLLLLTVPAVLSGRGAY